MALAATTVWEIRTTGADTNGGSFDSAAAGTDYSQQDAHQVHIDNSTITTSITTNTITFTAGYTATAADVGNTVQMLTGTNVTAGFYKITAQGGTTWTMDRNVVSSGTTVDATGKMGGALASPGQLGSNYVAGNIVHVKAGTYTMSNSGNVSGGRWSMGVAGTAAAPITVIGYQTTRGDDGTKPVFAANANSVVCVTLGAGFIRIRNIKCINNGAFTSTTGFSSTTTGVHLYERCESSGGIAVGFANTVGLCQYRYCYATATGIGFSMSSGSTTFACVADACGNSGFSLNGAGTTFCAFCYSINGTGTSGFQINSNMSVIVNCVAYNNVGTNIDGFQTNGTPSGCLFVNCISVSNTRRGFTDATQSIHNRLVNCAAFGNGSATHNFLAGSVENFVTLTADPFTNAAGDDFTLNGTSGGGAELDGTAYPDDYPNLSTTNTGSPGGSGEALATASAGGGRPFNKVFRVW